MVSGLRALDHKRPSAGVSPSPQVLQIVLATLGFKAHMHAGSWTLVEQVLTPVGATSKVESSWNNLNTLNPKPRYEGFRVIRKHRDDIGFGL